MEKLEFEGFDSTDPLPESEGIDIIQISKEVERQSEAINFSNEVVRVLSSKAKKHNSQHLSNKVTLKQLKEVYVNGGEIFSKNKIWEGWFPEKNCADWAMSRVNMFLRMRGGDNRIDEEKVQTNITAGKFIDLSEGWCPIQEDFDLTKKDIKDNNLIFSFDSMEELYLEDYQRIDLDW